MGDRGDRLDRPRVVVTRRLPGGAVDRLRAVADVEVWGQRLPPSPEELRRVVAGADALVTMLTDRVDAAVLDACPDVRIVANVAVGYDNLDVAELTRRGVPATNTPGVLTESTADLAWALILAACRRLPEGAAAVKAGDWVTWEPDWLLGLDVAGATLGIVGYGRIGAAVARRAAGFGMEVLAWNRTPRRPDEAPGVAFVTLDDLLRRSDIVTLHCALTDATRGLVGAAELAAMKPTAVLVNTARGPIVDQRALAAALRAGDIFAAALDVVEEEPIPPDDELLDLPNCLVLPHVGSATVATRSRMADMAIDNVLAVLAGDPPPNCVNPERPERQSTR
jgi:lactate dehydrogenase-like 2-hydroxyacid dehydrogenase